MSIAGVMELKARKHISKHGWWQRYLLPRVSGIRIGKTIPGKHLVLAIHGAPSRYHVRQFMYDGTVRQARRIWNCKGQECIDQGNSPACQMLLILKHPAGELQCL